MFGKTIRDPRYLLETLIIVSLIGFFLIDSLFIEPNSLETREVKLTNLSSKDSSDGNQPGPIRIVFISDIHIGTDRSGRLAEIVSKINSLRPDLVLIGGDVIEGSASELPLLRPLANLTPKYGTYAVLGNHDYGLWGCPAHEGISNQVEASLNSLNITVLRNQNRILTINHRTFALVGLDDSWSCMNNYTKASLGTEGKKKIILTHNSLSLDPTQVDVDSDSLVLAGHTHCGQVRIPFVTEFILRPGFGNYLGGYYALTNNTDLFVSCGLSTWPPMRFLAPPEIVIVEY